MADSSSSIGHQLLLQEVKQKLMAYCAYQERSELEVTSKLSKMGLSEEEAIQLLEELKKEHFVDNQRFARLYSGGKFRSNKWGRLKIRQGLKLKGISDNLTSTALQQAIPTDEYIALIKQLISKKLHSFGPNPDWKDKQKVFRYMRSKGFESELVLSELDKLL